ncbi:MAG TPA: hypothetical protein VGO00_05570 [Kofleriaceae bacterium]|nr:hypothetical protein [Kofleriaceae bacterium]
MALGACSIPNNQFRATPDGGGDDIPSVLAIVPSASSIDVDEGSTKDFSVALSLPPNAPLTVSIATTAMTKLALSIPSLTFDAANFDQPQTVTATGLTDADTVDEQAPITLTAAGLDTVTVGATVHDLDKVSVITDAGSTKVVTVNEGGTATVHVHLSVQPTGDVSVSAILGTGPVTVSPSVRVFSAANYDTDQVFTFTAIVDANTTSEDESLTFRATGVPDSILSIHDVDKDVQNILVSPTSATITEQGAAATLNVSLTQQPTTSVTVTITTTTGQAVIDSGTLTFTPQSYNTTQPVHVTAPDDADTADGADTIVVSATDPDGGGHLSRNVAITIKDNDVQQILEDAPNPLAVTETSTSAFNATLKFKPATNIVVSVTSLDANVATATPGTITFTPADYNQPHAVTVHGVHDGNLATNTTSVRLFESTIGMTDVPVSVADVDHQVIVLSTTNLTIPEGGMGSFGVSLMFDPGTTVTVSLADTNATSLPIDKPSLTFTTSNFGTPQTVTIHPPVDSNNVGETATITVSGAGAPAPATLMATVTDATVITQFGWPMPFSSTSSVILGEVIAYKITVPASTTLDSFGVYVPAGTGDFRMALYADGLNQPGTLVAQMPVRQAITNGINTANIPDVAIPTGNYWIAFRVAQTTAVGYSTAGTGPECVRDIDIPNLDDVWPTTFGTASCSVDNFDNFFITTYHQ